jgi:AcrR family transcriptional regulator
MVDTKKKAILTAARQCFGQYGFSKTTMDDIGSMVGLNKTSLYYYYKSKEAIFCALIEEEGQNFISYLTQKIAKMTDWDRQIQTYFLGRLKFFQENNILDKLSVQAAMELRHQPVFRKMKADFTDRETLIIKKMLDRAADVGEIRKDDTWKTANLILSVANGLRSEYMETRNLGQTIAESDYNALREDTQLIVRLVLDGLKTTRETLQ